MVAVEHRIYRVRVYELAKDLGVSSKDLMAQATRLGHFVRSASSVLPAPVVLELRQVVVARIESGEIRLPPQAPPPLASTWTPPPTPRRPAPRTSRRSPWVQAMLDNVVPLLKHPSVRLSDLEYLGPPDREDIALAERLTAEWSGQWFEPSEAVAWLQVHKMIAAENALNLASAGFTPEMAAKHVWYGKVSRVTPRWPSASSVAISRPRRPAPSTTGPSR